MDKQAIAERLQLLATDDTKRSKAARLREIIEDVERALAAGARRADVLATLRAHGLEMSLSTFETTLKRLRAQRGRGPAVTPATPPVAATLSRPAAATGATAGDALDPTLGRDGLDRIIQSKPDLVALARYANRSPK